MISKNDIRKMSIKADEQMYGAMSQDIRLEWITKVGGTYIVTHNVTEGGTDTLNILDTKAIISHVDDRRLLELGMTLTDADFFFINIDTDINLKTKPNFHIIQKIDTKYYQGNGTGASAVWTPGVAPSWTINEWVGYWLFFSDRRFLIVSNTATALTVTLGNYTLPSSATSGDIMAVKDYKPIMDAPSLSDGLRTALGSGVLFQTVICTTTGSVGDQT